MAANSKIEWTHHTFNPWWGCTKVSAGCANCYAERDSKRYGHDVWGDNAERRFFTDKHWAEPLKWDAQAKAAGQRHRVFCASMADVFEGRDDLLPWLFRLTDLVRRTPNLDWLLLTKRPELIVPRLGACVEQGGICATEEGQDQTIIWLADWLSGKPPHNVWLLTSVEDQPTAERRIPELLKTPAVIHGLSMEPLLGPVNLERLRPLNPNAPCTTDAFTNETVWPDGDSDMGVGQVDWVIAGGESGPKARPMHPDWPRSLRDQCHAADVPFFFKQWGEYAPFCQADHREISPKHFVCRCGFHGPIDLATIEEHRVGCAYGATHGTVRMGKAAAGRLLDGREHNEFPKDGKDAPATPTHK